VEPELKYSIKTIKSIAVSTSKNWMHTWTSLIHFIEFNLINFLKFHFIKLHCFVFLIFDQLSIVLSHNQSCQSFFGYPFFFLLFHS
jgi:hypothetical protein